MIKQNILNSFFLAFLLSGVFFFEFINYQFFTYTGFHYKKLEVVISLLFLHFSLFICFLFYFWLIELNFLENFKSFFNKILKIVLFFFFVRIFIKSSGYPGLIYFFENNFGFGNEMFEKISIFIVIFFILFWIDSLIEKKGMNTINFFKIYGIFISIIICFQLFTNPIFKDKNLVFKSEFEIVKNIKIDKKVIFLIFDTFDYNLAFDKINNFSLLNIERLKKKSIFFENAYPPASKTLSVIPSLILGESPIGFDVSGKFKDLKLINNHVNEVDFNYKNSIFNDLNKKFNMKNENFSILGRYHPVCNIFDQINCVNTSKFETGTKLYWYSGLVRFCETISEIVVLFKRVKFCNSGNIRKKLLEKSIYAEIGFLDKNLENLFNNDANFIFAHVLPPKTGGFYYGKDFIKGPNKIYREKKKLIAKHRGYAQNMIYADELIGRIMNVYSDQKFRDKMLIITGDTSNIMEGNISDKVPLIININSAQNSLIISEKVNTLSLNKLIINFFNNDLKEYSDVSNFFENETFNSPLPNN